MRRLLLDARAVLKKPIPFYASYIVFELDPDYRYAYVSGFNKDYLWLLARDSKVSDEIREDFVERAVALGFSTENLIWRE